jgi:hypothetical protein
MNRQQVYIHYLTVNGRDMIGRWRARQGPGVEKQARRGAGGGGRTDCAMRASVGVNVAMNARFPTSQDTFTYLHKSQSRQTLVVSALSFIAS